MIEIKQSTTFTAWLGGLKDTVGRARILDRIERVKADNFGDHKTIEGQISEMRLKFGPGYRIYYMREGDTVVILLCGGDKGSQARDIEKAKKIAEDWNTQ